MATTPCGLSHERIAQIIKDVIVPGKFTASDRADLMKTLLTDKSLGLIYPEAREISDTYYSIYRRVAEGFKKKTPSAFLDDKKKFEKVINNLIVDYISGKTSKFPLAEADEDALREIYKKQSKALTQDLKAKYEEEANVLIQKSLPTYTDELFKTFVYANPLLSIVFFIKSIMSNLYARGERSLFGSIWDGKKADFTSLTKLGLDRLGAIKGLDVVQGGIPATSMFQAEAGFDPKKGRLEEYSLPPESNTWWYKTLKLWAKLSNRFNAAPDTVGIYHNAERHFYQLLKEHYRDSGMSVKEAQQKALKNIELGDLEESEEAVKKNFDELGLPVMKDGKQTMQYEIAVEEHRRINRDEEIWAKALTFSKNDFWKKNMMAKSQLGFGDYGVFGFKAQLYTKFRDWVEGHSKSKVTSAFNLSAFGYINGAANFAEDALERTLVYPALKYYLLSRKKGDPAISKDVLQEINMRQRDLVSKNLSTVSFFFMARMIERMFCDKQSVPAADVSEGYTPIGPCGIPAFVPSQMMVAYKAYDIISKNSNNDEEFFVTAMQVLPVLTQTNQMGLAGTFDKIAGYGSEWIKYKMQGNNISADETSWKMLREGLNSGLRVANSFLPIPSRLMGEIGTLVQQRRDITRDQNRLPFAINDAGNKLGFFNSLGRVTIASMGNITGITDIWVAAKGSDKTYAVDWQGRRILQFRGSDIQGTGIQYNTADDIISEVGIKAPYINRFQKVNVQSEKSTDYLMGLGIETENKKLRYLSDEEFFNVSEALGKFNNKYFSENESELVQAVKDNKESAKVFMEKLFSSSKQAALEAIEKGITSQPEILSYIESNWRPKRKVRKTQSEVVEE